jgi:hypothetical protein
MRTRPLIFRAVSTVIVAVAVSLASPTQAGAAKEIKIEADRPGNLASGAKAVMKMYKSGVAADIVAGYVNNSPLSFYLTADDIIFFQQEGVPSDIVRAMIHRYAEMQQQTGSAMAANASVPAPVPSPAPMPQYYPDTAAGLDASYPYVPPVYPIYSPYNYDSFYYLWYPSYGRAFFNGGIRRVASVGHVASVGRAGVARGGSGVHFGGAVHLGGGGGHVASGGHAGGGHGGGRR